jgi:multiple sugar transport system substrate-binding protein
MEKKKRKLSRRDFLRLSAGAGTGALMAACAPKTVVVEKRVEVEKEVEKQVTQIVKETVVVEKVITATPEPVTLVWYIMRRADELPTWQSMADLFMERNPYITIKTQNEPSGGRDKLLTMMAAGTPPDVLRWEVGGMLELADKGALVDLNPFIDAPPGIEEIEDFVPQSIEAFQYKGGQYAVPMVFSTLVMHCNRNLFQEAGVDFPEDGWNWSDYAEKGTKLVQKDASGKTKVWGAHFDSWVIGRVVAFIWQNGGELFDKDLTKCLLDSDESIGAVQFLMDMIYKYGASPTPIEAKSLGMGGDDMFMSGLVAMRIVGPWVRNRYNAKEGLDYDVVPLPDGKVCATPLFVGGFGITTGSKYREQAWEYTRFLTSKEAHNLWASYGESSPARKSAALSDAFLVQSPITRTCT